MIRVILIVLVVVLFGTVVVALSPYLGGMR